MRTGGAEGSFRATLHPGATHPTTVKVKEVARELIDKMGNLFGDVLKGIGCFCSAKYSSLTNILTNLFTSEEDEITHYEFRGDGEGRIDEDPTESFSRRSRWAEEDRD